MQRDPFRDLRPTSLYLYVDAAPVTALDSLGLFAPKVTGQICKYLHSDCIGNSIGCMCGFIGWLDAFNVPFPAFPPPWNYIVMNGLDCLCEMTDVLTVACHECPDDIKWFQLLTEATLGSLGCVLDMLSIGGVDLGDIGLDIEKLLELIQNIIDILMGSIGEGVPPFWTHCVNAARGCGLTPAGW